MKGMREDFTKFFIERGYGCINCRKYLDCNRNERVEENNFHIHEMKSISPFEELPKWKIKISLNEEWFYIWIEAYKVGQVGCSDLLVDGRMIKTQGYIESVNKETI